VHPAALPICAFTIVVDAGMLSAFDERAKIPGVVD
jgi:hypothetical protein